jgi:hypothetical protein
LLITAEFRADLASPHDFAPGLSAGQQQAPSFAGCAGFLLQMQRHL